MSSTLLARVQGSAFSVLYLVLVGRPCTCVRGLEQTDSYAVVSACLAGEGMIIAWGSMNFSFELVLFDWKWVGDITT